MLPDVGAGAWPFVGREDELATVADGRAGAVLAGGSGIGKSRLLAEVVDRIPAPDHRIVRVAATESLAAVPFGAFAGVLACDLDPGAPFTALSRALVALAGERFLDQVVLVVDDAHLLDDASAGLVLLAAQSGARVLATVRAGEAVPDAVTRLWKEEHAQRIEVRPLDDDGVSALLREVLGGPLDARSRHRLLAETRGNLLFLRELVRYALHDGALVERDGIWSWTTPPSVAPGIHELIEHRLQSVSSEAYGVVATLAVCEPLGRAIVERACSPAACEAARAEGVVAFHPSGRRDELRLVHPLYVQVVQTRLGASRRSDIATRVADALAEVGARRRDDRLRAAVLRLDAGVHDDARTLAIATREAGSRGDLTLALRLARAAVAAGGGAESLVLLGTILYWAGQHDEVVEMLGHELPGATPEQVASAALLVASSLYFGSGRFDEADEWLLRAIEHVGPNRSRSLLAQRSQILMFAGRARESIEVGRPVLDDASSSLDARLRAYSGVLISEAMCGEVVAVEAELPVAMQLVLEASADLSIYTSGGVVVATFVVRLFSGRLDEVDALLAGLHGDAVRRAGDPWVGAWSLLLARSSLARGRIAEAIARSRDAVSLLGHRDFRGMLPWSLATLAQALGAAGDAEGALAALDELAAARMPGMHHIDVDIELGKAWAAAARGERSHAREIALKVGRALLLDGQLATGAFALHDALRLGADPVDVLGDLDDAAAGCEGAVVAAFARHARARAADDLEGLLDAADAFDAAGWRLHAAECAAGASGVAAARGLRVQAREAALRCAALLVPSGHVATPLLEAAGHRPALASLTRREQEVALLAAQGMSKREIADTLFLSVRTIGNHINHVYGKLGIGSREELRLALHVLGTDA